MASRGLVRSRTQAARLIAAGLVTVNGAGGVRGSDRVTETDVIEASGDRWVSRAAHKLVRALDVFGIDPADRECADIGASTGGFTQVLLERRARHVAAIDVGHDQIDAEIAADDRVTNIEGCNARELDAASYLSLSDRDALPTLIVGDLSFISLTRVLDALIRIQAPGADLVLLIKPQFEVGRTEVKGGLVTDPAQHERSIRIVTDYARGLGLETRGLAASPILGTEGNREFLVWLRAGAEDEIGREPTAEVIARIVRESEGGDVWLSKR